MYSVTELGNKLQENGSIMPISSYAALPLVIQLFSSGACLSFKEVSTWKADLDCRGLGVIRFIGPTCLIVCTSLYFTQYKKEIVVVNSNSYEQLKCIQL